MVHGSQRFTKAFISFSIHLLTPTTTIYRHDRFLNQHLNEERSLVLVYIVRTYIN
ncbi:hypothetical protein H6F98_26050 [Microcoleus sp. FACHB-SPT15]|uniref:hypothetical protein n=1 Tax=Microcoleus sp. FACHB-SPT15 TaxID=2692830 RepID=UPI0017813C50|nr:hypothetical protein [Microcoleus sp. FACHB-SPT15]MBD1808891.1 hypothetical protein [Microcoleus sp. FACHB-SPT15]